MINMEQYILDHLPDAKPNHNGKIHTLCPFHDDSRASFSINLYDGLFICGSSSCGVRGTFPLFYKLMENKSSWKEVFEDLKQTSTNFTFDELFSSRKTYHSINTTVNQFPDQACLEPLNVVEYLANRNLGMDTIQTFGLQYGKTGKYGELNLWQTIVAPVWDIDGQYRTFQLRSLNKKAYVRWKNPEGSPIQDILYGGWLISNGGYLWVVEGASDTWRIWSLGGQAVGLNTKEASPAQMKRILTLCRLYKKTPVICMDSDAQEAGEKLFCEIDALGLNPKYVKLEEGDPGDLTQESYQEILKGFV